MNAPEGEYAEIVRKVKSGLAVIRAEADSLLSIESLRGTLTGENHLEEIKTQVKRIDGLVQKIK